MLTAIREVRRAKRMTLDDVARACVPPTTAQTIGRLETGTRTVSVAWLNRIAAALGVTAADLVTLPDRTSLPVAALLDADGAHAPRRPLSAAPPSAAPGGIAVTVVAGVGDYRAGDAIWCELLAPDAAPRALNRDVLIPRAGGQFAFGRLIAHEPGETGDPGEAGSAGKAGEAGETGGADETGRAGNRFHLLPPGPGARQIVVANPLWLAVATTLVRNL